MAETFALMTLFRCFAKFFDNVSRVTEPDCSLTQNSFSLVNRVKENFGEIHFLTGSLVDNGTRFGDAKLFKRALIIHNEFIACDAADNEE